MSEKKYRQAEIPSVTVSNSYKDGRRFLYDYYAQNLQGKTIVNRSIGIVIHFTKIGKYKLAHGGAIYAKKIAVTKCLDKLLEVAEYNNAGERKETDPKTVLCYLNFKARIMINGKVEHVRISIQFKTDGKFYYNHEINMVKEK